MRFMGLKLSFTVPGRRAQDLRRVVARDWAPTSGIIAVVEGDITRRDRLDRVGG